MAAGSDMGALCEIGALCRLSASARLSANARQATEEGDGEKAGIGDADDEVDDRLGGDAGVRGHTEPVSLLSLLRLSPLASGLLCLILGNAVRSRGAEGQL